MECKHCGGKMMGVYLRDGDRRYRFEEVYYCDGCDKFFNVDEVSGKQKRI